MLQTVKLLQATCMHIYVAIYVTKPEKTAGLIY